MPELKTKICVLQTPVISVKKGKKLCKWYYTLDDSVKLKPGEESHYMKGLGSWSKEDLQHILSTEGLNKMIKPMEFDSDKILEEWLGDDSAPRKKYLLNNVFKIASA